MNERTTFAEVKECLLAGLIVSGMSTVVMAAWFLTVEVDWKGRGR